MSELYDKSVEGNYREIQMSKSVNYGEGNEYNVTHPNALSDGDEKGKGLNNDSVGSSVDINHREFLMKRNRYKEYGVNGTSR